MAQLLNTVLTGTCFQIGGGSASLATTAVLPVPGQYSPAQLALDQQQKSEIWEPLLARSIGLLDKENLMLWKDVAKDWPAFTASIKARWPEVDDERVADLGGDRLAFNAYLGQVYQLTPREAEEQIDEWLQGPLPLDAVTDPLRDMTGIEESGRHIPDGEDALADDKRFGDDNVATPPVGRDTAALTRN